MKRYIRANSAELRSTLVQMMKDKSIDTSTCQYEFLARNWETGRDRKVKFTCPGDYLAYFAMAIHKAPTIKNLTDFYYDEESLMEEFADMLDTYPSVKDIHDYAFEYWTDDTSSWDTKYLKNLTHDTYLYGSEPDDEEEYVEEW